MLFVSTGQPLRLCNTAVSRSSSSVNRDTVVGKQTQTVVNRAGHQQRHTHTASRSYRLSVLGRFRDTRAAVARKEDTGKAGTRAGNHQRHTHRRVTTAPQRRTYPVVNFRSLSQQLVTIAWYVLTSSAQEAGSTRQKTGITIASS